MAQEIDWLRPALYHKMRHGLTGPGTLVRLYDQPHGYTNACLYEHMQIEDGDMDSCMDGWID